MRFAWYCKGEVLTVSRNLAYYERLIDSPSFFRIHQSYLVNVQFVDGLRARDRKGNFCIILKNGQELPLARSKKAAFAKLMSGKN